MSADDDTELRDLLVQTLERNGTLAKIRAQLRASVFLALEEQENVKKKTPLLNEKAKQFGDTDHGRLCAEVVADFLESLNLDATLSVFLAEFNLGQRRSRSVITRELGLASSVVSDTDPLLRTVLTRKDAGRDEKITPAVSSKQDLAPASISKTKPVADDDFVNGTTYFGNSKGKRLGGGDEESDEDDFFSSATRKKTQVATEKLPLPTTVTVREKSTSSGNRAAKEENQDKSDDQKNGSSSLSFLGDLPTLSSKNRSALSSFTNETRSKDVDFMKLLGGDSLDDTDKESTPGSSARKVPGLDLKKLNEQKSETKVKKDERSDESGQAGQKKNDNGNRTKSNETAEKSRKDSSVDDEISEEIAEDLEVDDLLDSNRSSRKFSF